MPGPYLRALPAGFDTPLFWNQTELNELVGSSALATVAERLRTLEQDYGQLRGVLVDQLALFSAEQFTFQRYAWATSVVWARSIMVSTGTGNGTAMEPVLVPVLDGLQHDHRVNTSLRVDEAGQRLVFAATQDYAEAGSPVLINWGERPNAVLLLNQGQVNRERENDPRERSERASKTKQTTDVGGHRRYQNHAI